MSRKYWLMGLSVILIALIAGGAYAVRGPLTYVSIATAYAAKQTCSCLHVSGRTMQSCLAEFPPDAQQHIHVSSSGNRVHAGVVFNVVSADADYDETYGCRIVN